MPADHFDRLERLFRAALMHPPEERSEFLDAACADDPDLRTEVESLLAADAKAEQDSFLNEPPTSLLNEAVGEATPEPISHLIGKQVGPYKILRSLGEGGMGTVFLALREEPFKQYIALKIVRGGAHSPEVLRRFEQERQILASLHHPGIARLLDGNVTEDGTPYFALEYVEGVPITKYADEQKLPIEERIRLFRDVCAAVHYAHQNLVLHRDLKPSNILVTPEGAVKLLDFGIAKVLNPHLAPSAMPVTRTALRVMTPEYASPEQVRGEPLSTSSDVYGLGVILYELLTGHRPYRLERGTTDEMIRVVCEEDAERPSTKVVRDETINKSDGTTSTITAEMVSLARAASPDKLRRHLKGDLDNIVLMTLRKEPQRRYASAEALADDLQRYLDGHPVSAHRDSRRYRFSKLVRRHPIETTAFSALLIMVLGFVVFLEIQNKRVAHERDRAQLEQDKAEQVSDFLVGLFEQANPLNTHGDTLTAQQMLEDGAARVDRELADQPEIQSEILMVMSSAYRSLGQNASARPLLERAVELRAQSLGEDDPLTLESKFLLGTLLEVSGEMDAAGELYESVLESHGQRVGDTHVDLILPMYHLGLIRHIQGRGAEADSLFSAWEDLVNRLPDADSPELSQGLANFSDLMFTQRRFAEAEPYARRGLAMDRRLYGDESPSVGYMLNRLTEVLNQTNRYAEAKPHATEALSLHRRLYPNGSRELASSLQNMGEVEQGLGNYAEAEQLFLEDLDMRRSIFGQSHYTTARSLILLGRLHHDWDKLDTAEQYMQESVDLFSRQFGDTFLTTVQHTLELSDVIVDQGRVEEAEQILTDAYRTVEDRGPNNHVRVGALRRLVRLYTRTGRTEDAARMRGLLPPEHRENI